jgi:hypothetical protein
MSHRRTGFMEVIFDSHISVETIMISSVMFAMAIGTVTFRVAMTRPISAMGTIVARRDRKRFRGTGSWVLAVICN